MSAAEPSQGANSAPLGGSAAGQPQAWGDPTTGAGAKRGCFLSGGSAAALAASVEVVR